MKSLKGHFLIASAELADPNFAKTVVLLVDHSEQGAFGVVLNRPTGNTVAELWARVSQSPCASGEHVYLGGPVSGPLVALHAAGDLSEIEVARGVFFAAQRDHLEGLVAKAVQPLRLFVGHSGWGGGQLERELNEGAWRTLEASAELVFYDGADLWEKATRRVGDAILCAALGVKSLPEDPSVN